MSLIDRDRIINLLRENLSVYKNKVNNNSRLQNIRSKIMNKI